MPVAATNPHAMPAAGRPAHCCSGGHRVRDAGVSDDDRNYSLAMHLTPFAACIFGPHFFTPLVMWLIRKDKSEFVDDHGRELVNFILSTTLFFFALFWTVVVPLALMVIVTVSLIRGAIAASNREYFRYPITIRFLK